MWRADGDGRLRRGDVGALFDWYFNGDVEIPTAEPWAFKLSEPSDRVVRQMIEHCGTLVVGRGEFDRTHCWAATRWAVVKGAAGAPWGYFGYFGDPDGYLWKVAPSSS